MPKWIYMAAALLVLALVPSRGTEIGELRPAELIYLSKQGGDYLIMDDLGNAGKGETIERAINQMALTSSGKVFLDTAQYLVITEEAETAADQMIHMLRPGTQLCWGEGEIEPEPAAKYLRVHSPEMTLLQWQIQDGEKTILKEEAGEYRIERR